MAAGWSVDVSSEFHVVTSYRFINILKDNLVCFDVGSARRRRAV